MGDHRLSKEAEEHIKKKILDIPYASQSPSQILDIWYPNQESDKPYPVIVHFHGGGFKFGGHREDSVEPMLRGTDRGYVVVSVEYRKSGEARFPAMLYDAKAAIRFLKANARKYQLDPDRIALWGPSEGGWIVSMAALTPGNPAFEDLTMGNAERTEPLTMIGPKGLERVVNALRVIAPELPFEIKFIELTELEETIELKGYTIHAFRVNHNVTCYGYTLEIPRAGRFSVEHALEQQIPQKYWSRLQKGEIIEEEDKTYLPEMVLGPPRKGIKLTYCTDTRPTESIAKNAKDSDLFICEGMYAEKEKLAKAKQYKHMTFYEAAHLAKDAGVKEMWLTHFSPSLVRGEDYMDAVRKIYPNAYLGKDGKSVTLDFEEA